MKPIKEVAQPEKKMWTRECPVKADAGDAYYFVRRVDRNEVVVMGFSMGKGWLNGVSYEPSEMRSHLFLGPLLPSDTEELLALREAAQKALNLMGYLHWNDDPLGRRDKAEVYRALSAALNKDNAGKE